MSLRVQIVTMPDNNKTPGLDQAFRKLFGGGSWNDQTKIMNDKGEVEDAVFTGVLQNDINFGFSNSFQGNLLSTIDQVTQSIGGNVAGGAVTALWGMAKAGSTLAGYTLGTTGVASTKTYNGSSISSFTLDVKWLNGYSAKADKKNFKDSNLKCLLRMAYPVGLSEDSTSEAPNLEDLKAIKDMEFGWDGGDYTNAAGIMLQSALYSLGQSIARPPVPVDISIYSGTKVLYRFTNFVISNLNLFGSRETYGGRSLVTGASISFEIYQTPTVGNSSSRGTIIFNGVNLLSEKAESGLTEDQQKYLNQRKAGRLDESGIV